ncbi:hypothetical protein MCHIJ_32450 [Mycolicibacterium chitae]|uniref:Transcriptional regulator, WhiB family n=1 Tax=Mycolicibacterium chitae TaxID=1792 RepID=A0A448I593_MYCCI|nr:hypothetical protein MCHIJ_32450 [Mycolicibacterium chitae]VEG47462.1 Putative transcriptional regulator, WhiB family [Mycolicibacterium chitae]
MLKQRPVAPVIDGIDWEIVEFVVRWAPFGGPDPEEALPRFGMTSEQLSARCAHIVARVGRFESRLDGHRRALLGRARQFLESGGTDIATLDPMARPGRWVARRGVWHWQ